jgi:site-specific recombinase XerD
MAANGDWTSDKYVQNWFELLGNERTIKNYKNDFPKFLVYIQENTEYKTPTEIINSRLQQLTTQDLLKRRFWEQQVVKYKNSLEEKNLRMATIHGHIRTVMSFFSKNGVKLLFSRGELKINPSEKDKVDSEWIPSNEEVRLLYRLCDNARDRAILLTLYQGGFSEVDVASMQIQDFPFYDENGNWAIASNFDLYHKRRREKTNQWQQTCLSREVLEEIRIMLQGRGFPQNGYLFVSFRGEQLGVRGINDMLKGVVSKGFNGKAKLWKTKHLRDAFMNGLLQAKLTQEVKDAMVGHKRQGARNDYAITELTIKTAYTEAFRYLTINGYGQQSRKIAELSDQIQHLNMQNAALMKMLDAALTPEQRKYAILELAKQQPNMTSEKLIHIENMLKMFKSTEKVVEELENVSLGKKPKHTN